jgi:hypothetical protein
MILGQNKIKNESSYLLMILDSHNSKLKQEKKFLNPISIALIMYFSEHGILSHQYRNQFEEEI